MPGDSSQAIDASTQTGFIDTNVWLYAFIEGDDANKNRLARSLLQTVIPLVSVQVVNEICVNLLRRKVCTEAEVALLISAFFVKYEISVTTEAVLLDACRLRANYSMSYWDSQVVASALTMGATFLYSEDMQHDLLIDGRLRIVNPFLGR